MSKLNLKARESKASKGSDEDFAPSKPRLKAKADPKPKSLLASNKKVSPMTAMDTEKKAASSLYSFSKFASSGDDTTAASPSTSAAKPARFSERYGSYSADNDGGGNLMKIVIFIGVIIAVGLGVIYLIQNDVISNFMNGGNSQDSSSTSTSNDIVEEPGLRISNLVQPDSESNGTGANADYTADTLSVGSINNSNENPLVDRLVYQAYDSFTRITWEMAGVDAGFPATEVSVDDSNNIVVQFTGVDTEQSRLLQPIVPLVGAIALIEATQTSDALVFNLDVIEPSQYYLDFTESNTGLVLDVKTQTQLETPSSQTSTTTSTTSSVTSTTSSTSSVTSSATSSVTTTTTSSANNNSGGNVLENPRSQNSQEIVNTTSGVNAIMENYSYQDFGPRFEFNWEFKGSTLASVPDVTAEIIQNNGKFYIEVVMSNVSYDLFFGNGFNQANFGSVDLTYSNLKNVIFRGREGNTSTYWVELGGREDYQLTATEVSNAGRRRVKIVAFD